MAATSAVKRRSATAVSRDSPTSMPTVRATTDSAPAVPCTSARVTASRTAFTGAIARPKPRPAAARVTVDQGPSRDRSSQPVITAKDNAASAIPPPATIRGGTVRHSHPPATAPTCTRSEEHTSELQSRQYLACRLLLAQIPSAAWQKTKQHKLK